MSDNVQNYSNMCATYGRIKHQIHILEQEAARLEKYLNDLAIKIEQEAKLVKNEAPRG